MNEVLNVIRERRSVRKFLDVQLSDEDINTIIEAGIHAPSGHNAQSVWYTVIQNKDLINYISRKSKEEMCKSDVDWIKRFGSSERYHLLHHAPTVIVVSANNDAYSPIEDCSAAVENMLLAAKSIGISSVWVGLSKYFFKLEESNTLLHIKDGFEPHYAICFGYEDVEKKYPKPTRNYEVIDWIK